MADVINLLEVRQQRLRAALFDELICEIHRTLRVNHMRVDGVFAVLKFSVPNGEPRFEYVQDGITLHDLSRLMTKIHQ